MIVDAASPEREAFGGDFDLCIVGTGPAGITIARALAARGLRIALMEAGGLDWSDESQDIYEGEIVGQDTFDLDAARLRHFGGSSNHWNGLCRELAPKDFVARPQNPLSGWPIGVDDIAPYREETNRILDTRPEHLTPAPPGAGAEDAFEAVDFLRSPPTRFAEKYHDEIAASEAIVLGLHANLVDLRLDASLRRVEAAVFRSYAADDPGFAVRARGFCLCTGGIENARLLLNFRDQIPVGIGNEHDLVGRFFSDHPAFTIGELVFEELPGTASHFFATSEILVAGHGTLTAMVRINHWPERNLALTTEALREVQCLPFVDRLAAAVLGERMAPCDRGGLADYWRSRDPERYPFGIVRLVIEPALNPDSRVMLSEERDALGLNRPRLDWRLSEIDLQTIRTSGLAFAGYAADARLGRMRVYDWLLDDDAALAETVRESQLGSNHHMGTTRMSDDPRQGVVDRNCRVHGTDNLYVGGSSVFTSPGYANPTYSIVQLALRLADHLGGELAGRG